MRLEGKVALITGAANGVQGEVMGFGGAAAWLFAREGAMVMLADVDECPGRETASQMARAGHRAHFVRLDVRDNHDWRNAIYAVVGSFGRIDALVNTAGSAAARTNVEETTEAIWDEQMAVHAKDVFLGTRAAIPWMRRAGGGSIINVSSVYAMVGSPGSTAYHAAKGAIRTFTKAAAVQYAAENIRVNSLHPGFARTPMTRKGLKDPERHDWLLDKVPMGRLAHADEIAYAMLFLASDESSFVTGAELVIDGGVTAQ